MKLLKTKKKKVWRSVCNGDYNYKDKETFYIVELSEKEFIDFSSIIKIAGSDREKLMKLLISSPAPNDGLKDLFTDDKKIIKLIKVYKDPTPDKNRKPAIKTNLTEGDKK